MFWSLNMIDCLSGWPNVYTIMLSSSVIEWSAVLQGGFSNALNKAFLDRIMHDVPPSTFSYTLYIAFWKIKLCWICSSCTFFSEGDVLYSFYWMFWPLFFFDGNLVWNSLVSTLATHGPLTRKGLFFIHVTKALSSCCIARRCTLWYLHFFTRWPFQHLLQHSICMSIQPLK